MQHLCVFNATVALSSNNQDLSLVSDQHLTKSASGKAIAPYNARITAAYAFGADLNRPRLVAPSLRDVSFPHIRPFELAAAPAAFPRVCIYERDYQPSIRANEEFNVQVGNDNVGTQVETCLLWLEPKYEPAPVGRCFSLRGTAAITIANGTWSAGTITLEDIIPTGTYAVVGLNAFGTNLAAARLIFADGGPRPGVLAEATKGLWDGSYWRFGRMGQLGTFQQNTVPNLECYGLGAGSSQEVILDVIKL